MIPIGTILLWSGSIETIPNTWHLCDGSSGTPDLRDRFIIGSGSTYNPDDIGGSNVHNHNFLSNGHFHVIPSGNVIAAGADKSGSSETVPVAGTTDNGGQKPPYYALAWIMKTG